MDFAEHYAIGEVDEDPLDAGSAVDQETLWTPPCGQETARGESVIN